MNTKAKFGSRFAVALCAAAVAAGVSHSAMGVTTNTLYVAEGQTLTVDQVVAAMTENRMTENRARNRFALKNGILFQDGKPTFAVGTSYYASFHPEKRTEPEGTDPYPNMRLDVHDIAAAGFNNIRTATLGEKRWEGGTLVGDTAFTDAMIGEAAANGIATIVRLNGYTMDFRSRDTRPVDSRGRPLPPLPKASCFIQQTLHDEALNWDTSEGTRQLAAHYGARDGVIGFQIYNEPVINFSSKETGTMYFDYRPETVAAFRRWLAEKGYMSAEEAEKVEAPVPPMAKDAEWRLWGLWHLFGTESVDALLCRANAAAREGAPGKESFTNFIGLPVFEQGSIAGSWFGCAKGMDILGWDVYLPLRGEVCYTVLSQIDSVENAAAAHGKHAWLPEVTCRTHMTVEDYERQAYAGVAAGYKGISWYLWRGDLGGPEVQLGGMVWNDRSKTAKFDEAVKVNRMLQKYGEAIVTAERVRDGAGILYSLYAASQTERDRRWYGAMEARYAELRKLGVTPVYVDAESLAENPLGVRLLFVPDYDALSPKEKAAVDAFAKDHAVIVDLNRFAPACGGEMYGVSTQSNWCFQTPGTAGGDNVDRRGRFLTEELLEIASVRPLFRIGADRGALVCGALTNKDRGYYLVSCVNIATDGSPAKGGRLSVLREAGDMREALYIDRSREQPLAVRKTEQGFEIDIPTFKTGGFFILLKTAAGRQVCDMAHGS